MYLRPQKLRIVRFRIDSSLNVRFVLLLPFTNMSKLDVFLFEGERGHTADASFHIERTNYILDDALAVDKSKLSDCSYNECKYPIASKRNCIAIRSNLMKKSTILDIDLVVNQYRYFSVFVSFLPLIGALVYIKFFSESSTGSSAVVLHTPGYQLVVEPDI